MQLQILDIVRGTTVDGPGFRTAIYIAGCKHQCPGCHNPESWDFNAGKAMTLDEIMAIVEEEDFDVTLSGGDPLYHPSEIAELIKRIKAIGHKTWVYTGFIMEEILSDNRLLNAIKEAEAVVDGPFIKELHDPDLRFRGSSNQKIYYTDNIPELTEP